ncbi:unnamed protein product [Dovyalis caffra]|uniref:Peptidase S54 rhomboid domain-containing protein n=1 Tax=Dovyalis caffra TaxID=77055 RepID=A0AAV1SMV5_9ROSI|nr:unnamed protein product [Dovyalis caffra]
MGQFRFHFQQKLSTPNPYYAFTYDKAAGTWKTRREKETGETREWDILDYTYQYWIVCSRSLFPGKLVEEEEGNFALWLSYIFTGVGANLVSWLVLPRNAVSVGASGAVFGLFAISVLVKITWDWRKILEVLILGQFVIDKVMEAAQASAAMTGPFRGTYLVQSVNHIAHLSGALIGVVLVWLVSRIPSPPDHEGSTLRGKSGKNR